MNGGERAGHLDDTGATVVLPGPVRRVVSLVPSLTETVAVSAPGLLVGATDWCTHPPDLVVTRLAGTKNPDVDRVIALAPDLVLANAEENRLVDLDRLRSAGVPVWVGDVRTVQGAFGSLTRMLAACGVARPHWLDRAERAWAEVVPLTPRRRAVVAIWRRPWMAVGSDTFAGSVLAALGVDNALAAAAERYPRISPDDLPAHDLVVLPDEPYLFTAQDGPEAFLPTPCALVPGRLLTWYGPSMVEAPTLLSRALGVPGDGVRSRPRGEPEA